MARPKVGTGKTVKLAVNIDAAMLDELNALTVLIQAHQRYGRTDRSQTAREALARGMEVIRREVEAEGEPPRRSTRKGG